MTLRWRKYPDEKPESGKYICISFYDGIQMDMCSGSFFLGSNEDYIRTILDDEVIFLKDYASLYWLPLDELEATLPKEMNEKRCVECGGPQYIYVSETELLCKEHYNKREGIEDCFVCNQPVYREEELKTYSPPRIYHIKCFLSYEIEGIHTKLNEQQNWLTMIYANLPKKYELKSPDGRPYCKKCGYFHIQPTTSCSYNNIPERR